MDPPASRPEIAEVEVWSASDMPYCSSANRTNLLVFDHTSDSSNWRSVSGRAVGTAESFSTVDLSDTHNDGQQHEDIMYSNPLINVTLRYNKIWSSPNDGIFFEVGGSGNGRSTEISITTPAELNYLQAGKQLRTGVYLQQCFRERQYVRGL